MNFKKVNHRYLFILFICSIAVTMSSCKKDYPKDIPEWVEDKIKEQKKECRNNKSCPCKEPNAYCLVIYENTFENGDIIYRFLTLNVSTYYSYEGNILCISGVNEDCSSMPHYGEPKVSSREIWNEYSWVHG